MANFAITNGSTAGSGTQQSLTTTYVSGVVSVGCSTANGGTTTFRRGKVYDILVGTNGTPADNFIEWEVARITTNSTATFVAAPPLDPADSIANTLACANSSTAGTVSVPDLWYVGVNQRASYRWVAAPGSELVWPATSSAGLVLRARSGGYTSTVTGSFLFQEQ